MGRINVKNGTPVGNQHLCKSCNWGQFTTGYRESELLAICTNSTPSFRLPFPVHECSEYSDRQMPGWKEMEKLAIDIQPPRASRKMCGFGSTNVISNHQLEEEDEEDVEEKDVEYDGDLVTQ